MYVIPDDVIVSQPVSPPNSVTSAAQAAVSEVDTVDSEFELAIPLVSDISFPSQLLFGPSYEVFVLVTVAPPCSYSSLFCILEPIFFPSASKYVVSVSGKPFQLVHVSDLTNAAPNNV